MDHTIEMVLGGVFVVVHAYGRFNTPNWSRSSTTPLRYQLGVGLYMLVALLSYLLLSLFPEVLSAAGNAALSSLAASLPRALTAALVLTVFIEKTPVFSTLDESLRRELHLIARIPSEATRLGAQLKSADFVLEPSGRPEIAKKLQHAGFHPDDVTFSDDGSDRFRWVCIESLMENLKRWQTEHGFCDFVAKGQDDYQRIRTSYEKLRQRAVSEFRVHHELAPALADVKAQTWLHNLRREFSVQVDELYSSICSFVSRGVLRTCVGAKTRHDEIKRLGFQIGGVPDRPLLTLDLLATVFILVGGVLLSAMLILGGGTDDPLQRLRIVFTVALSYSVAIVCAVYPKHRYELTTNRRDELPTATYLISGIVASCLHWLINFGMRCVWSIGEPDFARRAFDAALSAHPWLLLSFTLTFATAFVLDHAARSDSEKVSRWFDTAFVGSAMSAGGVIAALWLQSNGHPQAQDGWYFVFRIALSSGLVGAVVGYVVPFAYRKSTRKESQRVSPEDVSGGPTPPDSPSTVSDEFTTVTGAAADYAVRPTSAAAPNPCSSRIGTADGNGNGAGDCVLPRPHSGNPDIGVASKNGSLS